MTDNASNMAGWLTPVGSEPAYDDALDTAIAAWIKGITALNDDHIVLATGDEFTPPFPVSENGCSYSVTQITTDGLSIDANQQDNGAELWRNEVIRCQVAFYGPQGQLYATRLRDGNTLAQNGDEIRRLQLSVSECSSIFSRYLSLNNTLTRRHDLIVFLNRKTIRHYGIQSLVEAPVHFFGE